MASLIKISFIFIFSLEMVSPESKTPYRNKIMFQNYRLSLWSKHDVWVLVDKYVYIQVAK